MINFLDELSVGRGVDDLHFCHLILRICYLEALLLSPSVSDTLLGTHFIPFLSPLKNTLRGRRGRQKCSGCFESVPTKSVLYCNSLLIHYVLARCICIHYLILPGQFLLPSLICLSWHRFADCKTSVPCWYHVRTTRCLPHDTILLSQRKFF